MSNFLLEFQVFDCFVFFFELLLIIYIGFWSIVGFCLALNEKTRISKNIKIIILNVLGFLTNTVYLLVDSTLQSSGAGKSIRTKLKTVYYQMFVGLFLELVISLKKNPIFVSTPFH